MLVMTLLQKRKRNNDKNKRWRRENPIAYLQAAAKFRDNNRDTLKDYRLKIRYGISLEKYRQILKSQGGTCAICKKVETACHNFTKRKQNLAVDHCHKSGKIRGILCQDCNRGIGKFHEDVSRLKNAIQYLLRTKKEDGDFSPSSCD